MREFGEIWSYLNEGPLIWLTATLAAYVVGDAAAQVAGRRPLVNPVIVAVILLGLLLWATGTPYATYFEGAQFVHFLLGPATVSLAVPLWMARAHLRGVAFPLVAALVAGSGTAILSVLGIAVAFGLEPALLIALAPKSATAPVAIGIAETLGGSPTLTAVLALVTGLIGAVVTTPLLNALRIRDWRARGFATGVAAHGLGTARAYQVNETAGAFAGLGMGMNAVLTALAAPYVLALFL